LVKAPNKQNKNASRGKRNSGRSQGLALSASDMFEKQLSQRKDNIALKGSIILSSSTTGLNAVQLTPTSLGGRVGQIANFFQRFRIRRLVFRILPPVTSTGVSTSTVPFGVFDDTSTSGDIPTSILGITQLRCSVLAGNGRTVDQDLIYSPVDPNIWYHTVAESSASDPRFEVQAALLSFLPTGVTTNVQCYYTIEFEGASQAD